MDHKQERYKTCAIFFMFFTLSKDVQGGQTEQRQPRHHNIFVLRVFQNLFYFFACVPDFQDYFCRYSLFPRSRPHTVFKGNQRSSASHM